MGENNKTLNYFELQAIQNSEENEPDNKESEELEKSLMSESLPEDCTQEDEKSSSNERYNYLTDNLLPGFGWEVSCIISIFVSIIPLCFGFYKLFAYNNSYYSLVNAYVEGDAYNYIINANYATACFVLVAVLILFSAFCGVMWKLTQISDKCSNI